MLANMAELIRDVSMDYSDSHLDGIHNDKESRNIDFRRTNLPLFN